MNPEQLKQYLEFYRDLGVKELYRVSSQQAQAAATAPAPVAEPDIPIELPPLLPVNDTLEAIRLDIGECKRCRLCEKRNKIVFGVGDENRADDYWDIGPFVLRRNLFRPSSRLG